MKRGRSQSWVSHGNPVICGRAEKNPWQNPTARRQVTKRYGPPAVLPLNATVLGRVKGKLASLVLRTLDPACAPWRMLGSDGGRDATSRSGVGISGAQADPARGVLNSSLPKSTVLR